LLGVISLLAQPLGGQGIGTKPSFEKTPPSPYERTKPNQYEKALDLRLSPQTEEAPAGYRGKKRNPDSTTESTLTGKSSTAKAKKKVKKLPDKKATSDTVDVGFKKVEPSPYPAFSPKEMGVKK
jgi:hypothetical protein